jgi:hypothetical protein
MFAINTHWQTHFLFGAKTAVTQSSVFLCQQLEYGYEANFGFVSEKLCYKTYRICTLLRHHLQKQNGITIIN